MANVEDAINNQLKNIESKTGKSIDELFGFIAKSGLQKHGEIRANLQKEYSLGFGDANMLALQYSKRIQKPESGDPLESIYSAKNESLRQLHESLLAEIEKLGDFEISPKKSYVSLRKKKQFLTVGPGSKQRLEVGFNIKEARVTNLEELPKGGMCQYRTYLTDANEINPELLKNIRIAMSEAE